MTAEQKLYYEIGQQLVVLGQKLMELQQDGAEGEEDRKATSFGKRVANSMLKLGVPSNLRGYRYIETAMQLYYQNSNYQMVPMKVLYQEIAKKHGETAKKVENAIWNAIANMQRTGNQELIKTVFQNVTHSQNGRIKNSVFLHTLFDYVSLNVNVM